MRASVLPRAIEIVRVRKQLGRGRLQFHLAGGGSVEVKLGDRLNRSANPCASCQFKNECEEAFGDYVRVDPRLHLYFCYMRRDLGFQVSEYFGRPEELKQKMALFPEMNWSAVARKAILERIKFLEEMNKKLSKSTLTEEDTITLGRKIKHVVSKKFLKS